MSELFKCTERGCEYEFVTEDNRNKHVAAKHRGWRGGGSAQLDRIEESIKALHERLLK